MNKRIRKKQIQKYNKSNLAYLEYLLKEESEANWLLTKMLKQCLPFIPESESALREEIIQIWNSWHV